jgi:hypothetical protein
MRAVPLPPRSFVKLWVALGIVWTLFVAGAATELSSDTYDMTSTCEVK